MAPVILPKLPSSAEYEMMELSWARDMRPSGAGPSQRQDRIGTRHQLMVSVPVLKYGWCGAGVAADLAVARTGEGAVIQIPEPKIPVLNYGAPVADGSGQLGDTIRLRGLQPGVLIRKGKWISMFANGRWYAYFLREAVTVPGSGIATLPIYPMIRRSLLDGAQVEIAKPMIQGLTKDPLQRKLYRAGGIGFDFIIEEQE